MATPYKIDSDLLITYWKAATPSQRTFLSKNFSLNGETTQEAIVELHEKACNEWKPKIRKIHPECFKNDKYIDLSVLCDNMGQIILRDKEAKELLHNLIQIRNNGQYENIAFYLEDDYYHWEMIKDEMGHLILLPTKK